MKLSAVLHETIRLRRAIPVPAGWYAESWSQYDGTPSAAWLAAMKLLRAFLHGQPPAILYALVALMELGRDEGDKRHVDFLQWYTRASEACPKPAAAVDVLASKVALADYLEMGQWALAYQGIHVDRLLEG